MNKIKISLVLNAVITLLVILGCVIMFAGWSFTGSSPILEARSFNMFKYYTVDSNVLVALSSIVFIIYESLLLNKKIKKIPNGVYIFKHIGTVGVVLTFLVTLLFLAPTVDSGFLSLYRNSNLFFHLIVPILSFVSYVFFEKYPTKLRYALVGMSSMVVYMIFYFINVIVHYNGVVERKYDIYNFLRGNLINAVYVIPIMLIVTYALSYFLMDLNKKLLK